MKFTRSCVSVMRFSLFAGLVFIIMVGSAPGQLWAQAIDIGEVEQALHVSPLR